MARSAKNDSKGTGSIKKDQTGTAKIPSGTTAQRPSVLNSGTLRFNTSTNRLEYYNGSAYKNVSAQGTVTITQDSFTGDGSTTAFTMSTSVTSNQDQRIIVAVGNVFQNPATAYSLSGTTITFTSAPGNAETIVVIHGFDSTTDTA
jgi:hypothetical protein